MRLQELLQWPFLLWPSTLEWENNVELDLQVSEVEHRQPISEHLAKAEEATGVALVNPAQQTLGVKADQVCCNVLMRTTQTRSG